MTSTPSPLPRPHRPGGDAGRPPTTSGAAADPTRRGVLRTGAGLAGLAGLAVVGGTGAAYAGTADDADSPYLAGRGIADVTGEIAEVGMMGYGRVDQQASGLHTRLRARAFVVADRASGERVAFVVADLGMIFDSVHRTALRRLAERYGGLYTARNVMLTATHTHAGPGGHSHHVLYNLTTLGFHRQTFAAITDGIVEAVTRAHDDLAPATLRLTHGELRGASANRSLAAFARNPADITGHFPDGVDPQTTLLRVERGGRVVGVVNFFATHGTSLSGDNRLISGDNKGYAACHWERLAAGAEPGLVAAFAQTNAGDMSPNLSLTPPTHPEDVAATRANGLRQYEAAAAQLADSGAALTGPVDARLTYVDLSAVTVDPAYTGDGREHRTASPAIGAAMAAGSTEDGPAFPGFVEGENPLWDAISDTVIYAVSPELRAAHAPKDIFVPVGAMNELLPWVQEIAPVQLVRIGQLYLVGIPGEVTIGAGLRLRRTVAAAAGAADLRNVLVAGYANAYVHYVTTPEEYDAQQYEGGSTLFGRWELPALQQTAAALARAMREGQDVPAGPPPPDIAGAALSFQPGVVWDAPPLGSAFGDVLTEPEAAYAPGRRVTTVFAGAHPSNDLHRGGSYLFVERRSGEEWLAVADDGDWSTTLRWARDGLAASRVTITWDIPADAAPGTYRIRYEGDAKSLTGAIRPITGTTRAFAVGAG